jgi:hypothetical protein
MAERKIVVSLSEQTKMSSTSAEKIIAKCKENYAAYKGDCVEFASAVLESFFASPDFDGSVLADDVVKRLRDSAKYKWTKTTSIATAISQAKAGNFVVAGMKSADLGDTNGHLALVCGVNGQASGSPPVIVPVGYAGSISGNSIENARLTGTFKASMVREEKIDYFYKTPDIEPANTALTIMALIGARPLARRREPNVPMLAWGKHVSPRFRQQVSRIAARLGTQSDYLMAVMAFETGESFDPSQTTASSKAVGLIQFMPKTAVELGTSTEALSKMTAEEQLTFVEAYFAPYRGKLKNLGDIYLAVLWPKAVGKPDDSVLFTSSKQYQANKLLDLNKDGRITRHEAVSFVQRKLDKGMTEAHFG